MSGTISQLFERELTGGQSKFRISRSMMANGMVHVARKSIGKRVEENIFQIIVWDYRFKTRPFPIIGGLSSKPLCYRAAASEWQWLSIYLNGRESIPTQFASSDRAQINHGSIRHFRITTAYHKFWRFLVIDVIICRSHSSMIFHCYSNRANLP